MKPRDPVVDAWSLYLDACRGATREGAYESVEPLAWRRLEEQLRAAADERRRLEEQLLAAAAAEAAAAERARSAA